jgi:tetratricopeptide (TPR) repeat protein
LGEGIALRRARRLDEAEERFRQVLAADPACLPALYQLAETLRQQGALGRAIACCDRLIEHLPADARGRRLRADCLVQLDQPLAAVAGLIDALRATEGADTETREALEGLLHRRDLGLAEALAEGQGGERFDKAALRLLGESCLRLNHLPDAMACFEAVLALEPGCAVSMTGLARALILRGERGRAATWLNRALVHDPACLPALFGLGGLALDAGRPAEALALFERAAAADPDSRQVALLRAQALRELDRPDEAERWFRAAWDAAAGPRPGLDEMRHRGLRLARLRDALLLPVGPLSVPGAVDGGVLAPPGAPEHLRQRRAGPDGPRSATCWPQPPVADTPKTRPLLGSHLYVGPFHGHFGHFMAESSHRLWAYCACQDEIEQVLLLPGPVGQARSMPGDFGALPAFQRQALALFGVPAERIRLITAPTRVERLLLPEQAALFGGGIPPPSRYLDLLEENAERFFARYRPRQRSYPERLYVGRSHLLHQGGIAGEGYLERLLQAEGFVIFRPEGHDLFEQLLHYRHARVCLFSEGSALHGLEPLGRLQQCPTVAVLGRRPDNEPQWRRLVLPRTPGYAFCASATPLPAVAYNAVIGAPADWNALSVVHEPDRLLEFLRETLDVRLAGFDRDRFHLEEAADVARYLLRTRINSADPAWGQRALARFRERLAAASDNPYLR